MRKYSAMLLAVLGIGVATIALPAQGEVRCPEGRTASGKCVNPGLAEMNKLRALSFTQPKLSYTAPPFLPSDDRIYRVPRYFPEPYHPTVIIP